MCGLFAVIPTMAVSAEFAQKLRFLIRTLARENDTRGGHSWGLWSYDYEPFRGLGKIGESMEDLVQFTDTCWKPKKNGWIAGHTRFGTHGARSVENSHPFVHGDLTLAHNGIVQVKMEDEEVKAHPVDSGQLCIAISKFGMEEALKNTSGMCGLLFSDAYRRLYAYRSDQVLHVAKCPWGYAISSDARHLRLSLEFCGFFDNEITEFTESTVLAPWYEDFVPFEVKTKGRTTYTTYGTTYGGGCGAGQNGYRWWEREDEYGYKGYVPPVKGATGKASSLTSDYEIKLANGIIKTVAKGEKAGTLDVDLDAIVESMSDKDLHDAVVAMSERELKDAPPLDSIEREDLAFNALLAEVDTDRVTEYTKGDETILFDPNGGCDNCGMPCDDTGGFFFDQEFPSEPLSFCHDCLEDLKIQGYHSHSNMNN